MAKAATAPAQITVDLNDQIALVTGASRGIGRAIAVALARNGATVACVATNEEKLRETVDGITAAGGKAKAYVCNVSDSEAVDKLVGQVVEDFGRLDIVVNNAGITRDTLLPRMSDEQWDDVIATNLRGVFLLSRAASRTMMSQRYGRIINLSSVSGIRGNKGQTNYSASKAGVIGFTQSLALELAGRNVTVNAVAPGFIETDMTAGLPEDVRNAMLSQIALGRLGQPADIARAVAFLAGPGAAYITGETLHVNGGMYMP